MHTDEHASVTGARGSPATAARVRTLLAEEVGARRGAGEAGEWGHLVWDEIGRLVDGGKHLRAQLLLRTHDAFGGTRHDAAVRAAAGIEMLHGAFLLHDDLIDGDTVRRGTPNLAAIARERALLAGADVAVAQRWCEVVAVLAGDLALGLAHHLFATAELPAREALAVQRTVSRTLGTTVMGELGDVALELGLLPADAGSVRAVARGKTAAYSFACPLVLGAVVAGAPGRSEDDLWAVGECLGVAYQIVDDVREVLVDRARRSDLRRGKVTTLVERASLHPGWSAVEHLWGDPALDDAGAAVLRHFFVDSGAVAAGAAEVRELLAQACLRAQVLPRDVTRVVEKFAATVEDLLGDAVRGAAEPVQ
ncbi:polyprenyl synthetase family protein [Georgenia soli]|uniref:polyprenyl synthetase family protein n=1 Tax=Georgenia soli TaxID=638953 RepID=UPI001474B82E|nr:polyprenyl synthetase family protein [Georgenia soli]